MMHLRNNYIMALVKLGYSDGKGSVTDKHNSFYYHRSKYVGAITLEPLYPDAGLREIPAQLGIDNDDKIEDLSNLINLIHANGAKVIAHLNHPGRMANPKIPGNYWWSSTDKPCPNGGKAPERMDNEKMSIAKKLLVDAAIRAEKAGFDYIELQFGHGYLMAQFLSPEVNDRTDEYGGSFNNRAKYPLEVFDAVKDAVNIPIIIRMSAEEFTPNGIHIEEAIQLAKILETKGAAALHVVAATICNTPPWFFQHMFVPKGKIWELTAKIKENVTIPVIFVGKINSSKDIETIRTKYNGEYFAMGRALVADPDFVGKHMGIIHRNIRPCLACAEGCLGGVKSGKGLGCVVNPLVNTGLKVITKADKSKNIAIIGGGLAGMQAAILLHIRGHQVVLYEKNKLGGQFNLAYLPPKKESLKEIVDYFIKEIEENDIKVINEEATKATIENNNYDEVIMATGAVPVVPPIEGLRDYYWTAFLNDDELPRNKHIAVVGGGLIGLEVASKLVDNDNKVTIIEMLPEIASGMEMIEKVMTIKKLIAKNTEILTNHQLLKVDGNKLWVKSGDKITEIDGVDDIVMTTGMKPYLPFDISEKVTIHKIGDANKTGKAQQAIYDGFEIGMRL